MRNLHWQGGLLMTAASCLLMGVGGSGCTVPDLNTNLRPAGDPEVLAVLVMNDFAASLRESATYCADDPKTPHLVALPDFTTKVLCSDDNQPINDFNNDPMATPMVVSSVTDGVPDGWYVRIMFDELLDTDVETLIPVGDDLYAGSLLETQPVVLKCNGVDVPYDGYYVPNGNNVTWPVGPSLVVAPLDYDPIVSGSSCEISIKDNVVDKEGNQVPAAQRGPFAFGVAPLDLVGTDPKMGTIAEGASVALLFNRTLDGASLDPSEVVITTGGVAVTAVVTADDSTFLVEPVGGFLAPKVYTIGIAAGAVVSDISGATKTFTAATMPVTLTASPTCGNGLVFPGPGMVPIEECDDGNTDANDGCTACKVDNGFTCTAAEPSVCTAD